MKRKIALKRLSSSDLTLFEHHFRNTSGAKQKAINLDASVFVGAMFPVLPARIDFSRDRVILTLTIFGPGMAGAHAVTRKVLKQQKNWRLNGELIANPPEEPNRYDVLAPDDYAVLDFSGDLEPHTARMYLVSERSDSDKHLHSALNERYGAGFSARRGMLEITAEAISEIVESVNLPVDHPIRDLADFDALEDAALGGLQGITQLTSRRHVRPVSREELWQAKKTAEEIGRVGEEIVNSWLEGNSEDFRWEADSNAIAPYDFAIVANGVDLRRIDVKSTTGHFKNTIHISIAEVIEMTSSIDYEIYRIYSIEEHTAKLRIAGGLRSFAAEVLSSLSKLPPGVKVDGISMNPELLPFGEEHVVRLSEPLEDVRLSS